jgi:type II secretory pathway pseudopilin PulG
VELLVTIAVVAVLAALAFLATKRALITARKAGDLNNVRQLAMASMSMAGESGNVLPRLHSDANRSAPYWFSMEARVEMESNGLNRENCYAPTRNLYGGKPDYDWWEYRPNATVWHYVYFADDSEGGTPWYGDASGVKRPNPREWRGNPDVLRNGRPFARSLGDEVWYPLLWAGLCRDYGDTPRVCAIMENGEPLGMSVVYLDGRAEWVPRDQMEPRYNNGQLTIWW